MISVVVPAHDEAAVIGRCLAAMFRGASDGELDVTVVCNGCHDDTASRARRFTPAVRVLEVANASKADALRAGDLAAHGFPRVYVDADVVVSIDALRAVASALREPTPFVVAAPRAAFDLCNRPWSVRAFYRVWTAMPFFGKGFVGAGVYALSERGRARFVEFPRLIADDGFVRLLAAPDERTTVEGAHFTAFVPRDLRSVLRVMTRIRAGRRELWRARPDLLANETTRSVRTLRTVLANPRLWLAAPIYFAVMALAESRARRLLRAAASIPWGQDRTTRRADPAREQS